MKSSLPLIYNFNKIQFRFILIVLTVNLYIYFLLQVSSCICPCIFRKTFFWTRHFTEITYYLITNFQHLRNISVIHRIMRPNKRVHGSSLYDSSSHLLYLTEVSLFVLINGTKVFLQTKVTSLDLIKFDFLVWTSHWTVKYTFNNFDFQCCHFSIYLVW